MEFCFNSKKYATDWEISSKEMYEKGYYSWMCNQLKKYNYKNILEIGTGVGYNTLTLLENGFSVISIDKNNSCIEKAKKLVENSGYIVGTTGNKKKSDVIFILDDVFFNEIKLYGFEKDIDLILCWNIGFGDYIQKEDDKKVITDILINDGYQNIYEKGIGFESDYCEYIQRKICEYGKSISSDVHFIDRDSKSFKVNMEDSFHKILFDEYEFEEIIVNCMEIEISKDNGVRLNFNNKSDENVFLGSILLCNDKCDDEVKK
jgi:hypothetical protein